MVLSAPKSSSTYVSCRTRWYATWMWDGSKVRREGEGTYHEDQFKVVDEGPLDSISTFLVCLLCRTTLYENITNEAIDGRGRGRGRVSSIWRE